MANQFAEVQGELFADMEWIGTRFAGGWMFQDRAQSADGIPSIRHRLFIAVLDNGHVSQEPADFSFDMVTARRAAELEFGTEG